MAEALRERTVRVPMSLVAGAVQGIARALPRRAGNPVVVFTQDYGMAHRSAAAMLDALLRASGHAPAAVSLASQLDWQRAMRASRPGPIVLSAAPQDLGDDAAATRHATLVVALVYDPPTWPPMVFTGDLASQVNPVARALAWLRHPLLSRERARVARAVRARIEGLLTQP
jgi:hypothetical protein